ncbi:MAG: type I-B CRISPR-associated protein Cas7/Cst2/DevR [Caloramator sp.]|nr:type I-B CRISPR-associated protein Cas7/Cst2/DevR [Caloramator sp.]
MKNINGFIMINAPHSALNNAGMDEGARTENCVVVKKIRKGRENYAYISGQSFRYWIRDSLSKEMGWELSPITRDSKIAFTNADPVKYPDDDMFGYMRAQGKSDGGTVTRISPFKCSPLISVLPDRIVSDYGTMSRHEGDPVPYEHEFYSTVFKGIFSIDIDNSGRFIKQEKAGFKNITEKYIEKYKEDNNVIIDEQGIKLKKDVIVKRVSDIINVLPHLYGGAKNTSHLTDVTPKVLILTVINGGNQIFMDIAENKDGEATINVKALGEVLLDYDKDILSDVYIGIREGFNDELKEELIKFTSEYKGSHKIIITTPKDAAEKFSEILPQFID